jgi:hypothetical protein
MFILISIESECYTLVPSLPRYLVQIHARIRSCQKQVGLKKWVYTQNSLDVYSLEVRKSRG